jgi:hypothetical protein
MRPCGGAASGSACPAGPADSLFPTASWQWGQPATANGPGLLDLVPGM